MTSRLYDIPLPLRSPSVPKTIQHQMRYRFRYSAYMDPRPLSSLLFFLRPYFNHLLFTLCSHITDISFLDTFRFGFVYILSCQKVFLFIAIQFLHI
ncbi:hypothetical protein P691DRAFT_811232 [Macrolepiota fuliginosa MF-IS2]|uniref:Uncharacterized protein n=1 Tax=Macrolepiota fuliginosa MF-IS2 TaxID=1400762 RepID=A0A9P6BY67_9AGAR|nr:hypothetical protein P691DRAFT_811232 [Macrolepiota fuliginosa MF-IS2]